MGYGFGNLLADLATGGAASATNAAAALTDEVLDLASGAASDAASSSFGVVADLLASGGWQCTPPQSNNKPSHTATAGTDTSVVAAKELRYCPYEIEGDYLLNSETGRVWLIDRKEMTLLPLTRDLDRVEDAAFSVLLGRAKESLLSMRDEELNRLHHAERDDFTRSTDVLAKVLGDEAVRHEKTATRTR